MSMVAPGYEFKKPIRDKVQIWTKYRHGSEIPRPEALLFASGFSFCRLSLSLSALGSLEPG